MAAGGAVDLTVALLVGVLVGAAEIVSRYRDSPKDALLNLPAGLYLALNGLASIVALLLVWAFGVTFGLPEGDRLRWTRVLVAGVSAMTFFRTSLFFVKVGSQEFGVGPAGFIQILLAATDRAIDRRQGRDRLSGLDPLTRGLSL